SQDTSQHLLPSAWILEPRMLLKWALHTKYVRVILRIIVAHPPVSIERKSPMSEAAERVEAWRREKRKAGYRPVLLWLPIEAKSDLDALAYTRHQDPSACVAEAVHALATRQGPSKATGLNIKQVEDLISRKLAEVVTTQHLAPPASTTPEDDEPTPGGMNVSGRG